MGKIDLSKRQLKGKKEDSLPNTLWTLNALDLEDPSSMNTQREHIKGIKHGLIKEIIPTERRNKREIPNSV